MVKPVAERLLDAIEMGDKQAMRELYCPEAEIWHNTDGVVQSVEQSLAVVDAFIDSFSNIRFDQRRLRTFAGGLVQQHRMTAVAASGCKVEFHGCMVFQIRDGRIARLDEYFDSAALAPVYGQIESQPS